jgi:hypothetical protein
LLARRSGAYWTLSANEEVEAEPIANAVAGKVLGVTTKLARAIETTRDILAVLSNIVISPDTPDNVITARRLQISRLPIRAE